MLKISGPEDKSIYSGKEVDETYLAETEAVNNGASASLRKEYEQAVSNDPKLQKLTKDILIAEGEKVFKANCSMCHQMQGEGIPSVFPPLAKSDYLANLSSKTDRAELIQLLKLGKSGKITVNGNEFNGQMPPVANLSEQDLASLLTYITNSWGNKAKPFSIEEVKTGLAAASQGAK